MTKKIELEYMLNCTPKVLFNRLSTASGLSEWFADDVIIKGTKYTFKWDGTLNHAEMIEKKDNTMIRFEWEEKGHYFEFNIEKSEFTGDLSLNITDFAEEEDYDEVCWIWDSQVAKLKKVLGA